MILRYKECLCTKLFEIIPGLLIGCHQIKTKTLPKMDIGKKRCILTVNQAERGICEMKTSDGNYVYVRGNNICISREWVDQYYRYPTGSYEGFEVYVLDDFQKDHPLLKEFHIDLNDIMKNYLSTTATLIADTPEKMVPAVKMLYELMKQDEEDISLIRLQTFMILRMLAGNTKINPIRISALTPSQLHKAEETEKILTEHMNRRIPVRVMAEKMGISETSLKNYFRAVYGMNISEYMLQKRMQKAMELLRRNEKNISEIAQEAGYQNQSKFDAVFHRYTGFTPLAWQVKEGIR